MPRLTSNSMSISLGMLYLSCVKMRELHWTAKTEQKLALRGWHSANALALLLYLSLVGEKWKYVREKSGKSQGIWYLVWVATLTLLCYRETHSISLVLQSFLTNSILWNSAYSCFCNSILNITFCRNQNNFLVSTSYNSVYCVIVIKQI